MLDTYTFVLSFDSSQEMTVLPHYDTKMKLSTTKVSEYFSIDFGGVIVGAQDEIKYILICVNNLTNLLISIITDNVS